MAERMVIGSGFVDKATHKVNILGTIGVGDPSVAGLIVAAKEMVDTPDDTVYWIETLKSPARVPQTPLHLHPKSS